MSNLPNEFPQQVGEPSDIVSRGFAKVSANLPGDELGHPTSPDIAGDRLLFSRRSALVLGALTLLTGATESIPQVPYHDQAALVADVAMSDMQAVWGNLLGERDSSVSLDTLLTTYSFDNGLFRESSDPFSSYALVWPSSRALEALYVASLAPGQSKYRGIFDSRLRSVTENYLLDLPSSLPIGYSQAPTSLRETSDAPLDDDALWMAQLNMLAYRHTKDPGQLNIAKGVFNLAVSQWDQQNGGVFWQVQLDDATSHIRAVVSNATVAILGVDLYQQTGDRRYVQISERILEWMNKTLKDPADGMYYDHIDRDGDIGDAIYTYTQGIAAVAEAKLARVDPRHHSVRNAVEQINWDMKYFREHHTYGNPAFDSIWAESALWVAGQYNHPRFTRAVKRSIKEAINAEPDGATDLLDFAGNLTLRLLEKLSERSYGSLC